MGLLEIMDEDSFLKLWENLGNRAQVKQFLLQSFLLFHDLIDMEQFPEDWSVIRLSVTGKVVLKTMQELAKPLLMYFKDISLEHVIFDNQLWTGFFTLVRCFSKIPGFILTSSQG